MATSNNILSLEDHLESWIARIPEAGCWIWMGAASDRYGCINFLGRLWLAHRLIYELLSGAIPKDKELCHTCDVGLCVNPAHMFFGTHSQNMRDMVLKSRGKPPSFCGDKHYKVRISDAVVEEIGRRFAMKQRPRDIASALDLDRERVRNLCYKRKPRLAFSRGVLLAQPQ